VASRAALYTGMFAQNTGVFHFDPWTHLRTWLHDLKDNGYYIAEVGKVHHYPDDEVNGRAMMAYDERYSAENFPSMYDWDDYSNYLKAEGQPNPCKLIGDAARNGGPTGYYTFPLDEKYHVDEWVGRIGCRWLKDYNRKKPFFLHIGFVGPHDPFDPPQRFLDMYKGVDVPAPVASGTEFEDRPPQYRRFMERFRNPADTTGGKKDGAYGANRIDFFKMKEADFKDLRRHYYAKITMIDEQVGNIMKTLKERGLLDNTIIVFTSDHGDNMGDHQLMFKWMMTEQTTRIPMMVRLPGAVRGGTIDNRLFTQMDIGPTLLDFAGVKIPAYLDGRSNLARLKKGDTNCIPDKVYCQDNYMTMVRTENRRMIHYAGQPYGEYYDMESDPLEQKNLWSDSSRQEEIRRLRMEYLQWREVSTYLGSIERCKRGPTERRKWPAYFPDDPYFLQGWNLK
jgi:arylsulfatase A-like enzyme